MRAKSQADQILAYLTRGGSLTQRGAAQLFGCWRLGARIYDLRKAGHQIQTTYVNLRDGTRFAVYRSERP